jgi:hypothetical protein
MRIPLSLKITIQTHLKQLLTVIENVALVGIKDPLVLKKDPRETENCDKAISLIKRVQACTYLN